jgi:flagellar assembly factor FliW
MEMVSSDETQQSKELESPRIGKFTYRETDRYYCSSGMFGFPDEKNFIYYKSKNIEPFIWLQCEDNLELAFLIIDPRFCRPDYSLEMNRSQLQDLKLDDGDEHAIFVVASVPDDFKKTTLNFKGPIILNMTKRRLQQVILEHEELKVPMFNKKND